jgi:sulfur relay (sulfurtransferase) DsrC/TusE family protein
MSDLTDKIRSRGHWIVSIHPAAFVEDRVPYEDLDEILPSIAVRMRGWPVPYANFDRREMRRGNDWVGQDVDATVVSHYEAWRLFRSGLFTHLRSVSADWRSGADATARPQGADEVIEVWEILYYVTEIFELASRLALSPAGDEEMVIEVALHGLEGRRLVVGQPGRVPFSGEQRAHIQSLAEEVKLPRDQLVAERHKEAVRMAREFFLRFGWKPSVEQLVDHQRELIEH